jgi:tetratricopeptide (TPR) repeat protein
MGIFMLALAYCVTGRMEDGKKYLKELLRVGLSYQDHMIDLVNFLLSSGRYSYARHILETQLEIDKSDPRFEALLAECRKMLQNNENKS